MQIDLGYGTGKQTVTIPDANVSAVLYQNEFNTELSEQQIVLRALTESVASPRLRELVGADDKVVIVTSDITRPMPTAKVMPALLDELYAGGARPENITLVFALGSHRHHTDEEKKRLAGERAWQEIRCIDSTPEDCIHLGRTRRGTSVELSRAVVEADKRICIGNVEFHYFAGYSGGAKAIMPGVSTRDAIQQNHSMMVDENACAGKLEGNPIREDLEEAAAMVGVDFILNVVLDEHKKIVAAVSGDVTAAHRAGCRVIDKIYRKPIPARADIVIVSQGGAPKDLNLYQTQKALDNSKHAVKDGGTIILVGECSEGFGEKHFEEWMLMGVSPDEMIDRIKKNFVLGGHKAAAIAMVRRHAEICLVSKMDADLVRSMGLTPCESAQKAFDCAFEKYGKNASVIVMPFGGSTLPMAE